MAGAQNRQLMSISIAVLVVSILEYKLIEYLTSLRGVETYGPGFLLITVILFLVWITTFTYFWLQGKRVLLFSSVIIALPLLTRIPIRLIFYIDNMHRLNYLNATVALIIIMLFAPVSKTSFQTLNTAIRDHRTLVFWFAMLILNTVVTQVLRLGFFTGIVISFYRVGVPILVSLLIIEMSETIEDTKKFSAALIISLCIAVLMSHMGTIAKLGATGFGTGYVVRSEVTGFASWTMYATLLATTMPIVLAMIPTVSHKKWRILLWFSMAIFAFELLNTHTRGAILCLIPLLIVLVDKRWWKQVNVLWIVLSLFIIGTLFGDFVWTKLQMRPWGGEWRYDTSVVARLERIRWAWEYIRDHPFVGLGFGLPKSEYHVEIAQYIYNGFLSWWIFAGLGGVISFVAICIISIKNGWCAYRSGDPIIGLMGAGILASFMGWMINQFTTADQLTYFHPIESVSFFYVLVGLMAAAKQITMRSQDIVPKK